jgi:hypothetical protein
MNPSPSRVRPSFAAERNMVCLSLGSVRTRMPPQWLSA